MTYKLFRVTRYLIDDFATIQWTTEPAVGIRICPIAAVIPTQI